MRSAFLRAIDAQIRAIRWHRPVLLAFALLFAFWLGKCQHEQKDDTEFQVIYVPRTRLVATEPDTIIKWKERIVMRTVTVTQQVVARQGADTTVKSFCDTIWRTDTISKAVPSLIRSGRYNKNTLYLWEAQANGDLRREEFNGVHAPFDFAIRPQGALVQSSRFWWWRPLVRDAVIVGAGYAAGRLIH